MKLDPVKSSPLRRQVVDRIREAIFSGRFAPGEALREMHLARELQVSQATVREALVELESAGFVRRVQNKGTLVTLLSKKEVAERIGLRLVLEAEAGIEAARHLTPADIDDLRRLACDIDAAAAKDGPELAQADLAFHRRIWESAGNETLLRTLEQLTAPLFGFLAILRRTFGEDGRIEVNPHAVVIEALQSNDPATIREAFRRHIGETTVYHDFLASEAQDVSQLLTLENRS